MYPPRSRLPTGLRPHLPKVLGAVVAIAIALFYGFGRRAPSHRSYPTSNYPGQHGSQSQRAYPPSYAPPTAGREQTGVGFRTHGQWTQHYDKHGAEFGNPGPERYLQMAQSLRDRPVGGAVEETRRPDGVTTRFDRDSGAFLATNPDGTIRTFFKPNDGESYFRRQAYRE